MVEGRGPGLAGEFWFTWREEGRAVRPGINTRRTFTFGAFRRRFYLKRLIISAFVRRKRTNDISPSVQ